MTDRALNRRTSLQPHQIVYAEGGDERLYAEVIQIIPERKTCWARPITIVLASHTTVIAEDFPHKSSTVDSEWHDLRQASDLLLPMDLFQPALDMDLLPLLPQIYGPQELVMAEPEMATKATIAQRHLNQFVRHLCTAHPEKFPVSTKKLDVA